MSINDKSVSTHNPDDGGLISATFPAIGELIVAIFGGCCCVMNCTQEQKDNEQQRGTIEGGPCCPQLNPPPTALKKDAAGNPVVVPPGASDFELPEDQQPDGYEAPPPKPVHPPAPPAIYGGMCEQIKLQIGLHGTPYLKFAFAFEPILDIPPGLPDLPSLEIPALFGFPSLNLPSIPLPGLGIPDLKIPGVDLPGIPSLKFFDLSIDPFPGMPLFNFSLFPISLGLDLFKLKLPAIPDFDLCKIAKFCKLIKEDTPCDVNIPPIGINAALCWLIILLFFLMLIQPILAVLLGMKEKGLLTVDESPTDPENPQPAPPVVTMPPRISIVHSRSAATSDGSLMKFPFSGQGVQVVFTITAHELNQAFGQNLWVPPEGATIEEQLEPNVEHEGQVTSSSIASFRWTVHAPDTEYKSISDAEPPPSHYGVTFNAFKNALINPKNLEERKVLDRVKGMNQASDKQLVFLFEDQGLHEIYCEVTVGETTKVLATFIQIGEPELPQELPPLLKAMPRHSLPPREGIPDKGPAESRPPREEEDAREETSQETPARTTTTKKPGV